jgi:hypothetical protein
VAAPIATCLPQEAIPIDPAAFPPEDQKEIAQEDQAVKGMVEREVNTEVEQQDLAPENWYDTPADLDLICEAPCLCSAQQGGVASRRP